MPSIEKINHFLNSLSESDTLYVAHCLSFANQVRDLIKEFNLSHEDFCKGMEIPTELSNAYIKGGYNFSLRDFAKFNALKFRLLMDKKYEEARKEAEAVKFADYKYQQVNNA